MWCRCSPTTRTTARGRARQPPPRRCCATKPHEEDGHVWVRKFGRVEVPGNSDREKTNDDGYRGSHDERGLGLAGVRLVTSDAHAGLVEAIAANLPGAVWQRCRTHYAANLMSICPKSMWPAVKAMLHSVYDQPDAAAVGAQFDRLLDYVA